MWKILINKISDGWRHQIGEGLEKALASKYNMFEAFELKPQGVGFKPHGYHTALNIIICDLLLDLLFF